MVSRLIPPAIALALICALSAGTAEAATTSAKPTVKATAKTSAKPSAKPSAKTTAKPSVKATAKPTATKKAVVKKPVAKKPAVKKPAAKKVVKVAPTPKAIWPPKGFRAVGEIYARVPTAAELIAILSADKKLTLEAKQCIKKACGVVRIASTKGCTWWEILSKVSGPTSATDPKIITRGSLRTTVKSTAPKQIITVYLVSGESLTPKTTLGSLEISCYHSPVTEKIPTNVYSPTVVATPSDTPTPTESPSAEPTPAATIG